MVVEFVVKVVIAGFVLWAIWSLLQPRSIFKVRVKDGIAETAKGTVTAAFLEQVRETCMSHGVKRALVRGIVRGRRIALAFSRGMPPAAQQQLRNWWVVSGWPPAQGVERRRRR